MHEYRISMKDWFYPMYVNTVGLLFVRRTDVHLYKTEWSMSLVTYFHSLNGYVVVANSCILIVSSYLATLTHVQLSNMYAYGITFLALMFVANQYSEVSLINSLPCMVAIAGTVLCVSTHASHLLVCTLLYIALIRQHSEVIINSSLFMITTAYWHLVEIVWISILVLDVDYT
jgi:heme/copper-type cytochrome/quinol oxidase subunit 3